jgi:uncharacterized membrane protein YkvA (DUF1232 family)/2-polyprenyl-3-methyl-5-hydroxy-6-metoxy-1,4-benzoquinol methylase
MRWGRALAAAKATARYVGRNAYLMCLLARDRRVPWVARGVAVGSAGYVAIPFNLIPDYVPVVGFLDDIGVLWLGLWIARWLVPPQLVAEHRATVDRIFPAGSRDAARRPPKPREITPPGWAFGVDPSRRQFYSLRQSRYDALAGDISEEASAIPQGEALRLLIVGCGVGAELRHLAAKPHFAKLAISGANLDDRQIYRREIYEELFIGDLMHGYPQIASGAYDMLICEQVLEHLDEIDVAIGTLGRVLRPGGKAIVGVPIFPPPLHLVRRHIVPRLDAILGRRRPRGHRQAFSLASFLAAMQAHSDLRLVKARGFRIVSGGALQWLDNYRWWWKLNRRLGELVPALCIEVQAVMEKPRDGAEPSLNPSRCRPRPRASRRLRG